MNLKVTTGAVARKFGRQVLTLKKNSPALMFGAGVIGVTAAAVLACKATLKLGETLESGQESIKLAREVGQHEEKYNEADIQKAVAMTYVKTAYEVTKLYTPAVLVGVASIAALTGAHVTLNRRVAGLTAAYALVDRSFKDYRGRVVQELGIDKDLEFYHGAEEVEIVENTEEGDIVRRIKRLKGSKSPYSFLFDQNTSTDWEPNGSSNMTFLTIQQTWANNKLKAKGWLTLNDVLEMLGMQPTKAGMVCGWRYKAGTGDDYIDFGILLNNPEVANRFIHGYEKSVWLDFNCDGNIFESMED